MELWELPDDGGAEEALEVAAAGEFEARDQFFGNCGAADQVTALENSDGEASACEVRGGRQAVMASADDQSVPFLVLQRARGAAKASSPHSSLLFLTLSASSIEIQGTSNINPTVEVKKIYLYTSKITN